MRSSSQALYPLEAVRCLALYAQGLTTVNGQEPQATRPAIAELIDQLVCVQIDTLQRVQRSHYLAIWSRLGSYDPADLDALVYGGSQDDEGEDDRRIFEFWFHAACLLPLSEYRYRRQYMQSARRGRGERQRRWLAEEQNQDLLKEVYRRIEVEGAVKARDFEAAGGGAGTWWNWKPAKTALEHLFGRGDLMIADRVNFQRVYDLAERVLPEWVDRSDPGEKATTRHILERTMIATGVCAENQLADYCHDFTRTSVTGEIQTLIEEGIFQRIYTRLPGGRQLSLILHRDRMLDLQRCADGEIKAERTTFINPFDTFFYPGGRDEQLWGFRQVLEAYKPADQRIWGYYCLPILHGSELIGRLDPRLDRRAGRLHLEALHLEPGAEPSEQIVSAVAEAMMDFLHFHDADELVVERTAAGGFGGKLVRQMA
ncbi:MAG: crosslink repair DNA glycosylase YcaQ family protein [Anaerolineales bacterium]